MIIKKGLKLGLKLAHTFRGFGRLWGTCCGMATLQTSIFLKMGYSNLIVVFTRALKQGLEHHTYTRAPPVYSFFQSYFF